MANKRKKENEVIENNFDFYFENELASSDDAVRIKSGFGSQTKTALVPIEEAERIISFQHSLGLPCDYVK